MTVRLTERQLKFARFSVAGYAPKEAMELAGYRPTENTTNLNNLLTSDNINRYMREALRVSKVTPERIADVVAEGLAAVSTMYVKHKGEIIDERQVPDHKTRLACVDIALKVLDAMPAATVDPNLPAPSAATVQYGPLDPKWLADMSESDLDAAMAKKRELRRAALRST